MIYEDLKSQNLLLNSYAANHTPGSPSLSTRLCTGNGELAKYNDEEVPPEEICLRIQESY